MSSTPQPTGGQPAQPAYGPGTTPRWLLLLLAVLAALVVGQAAGIVVAAGGAKAVTAVSTGFIAFGSAFFTMLTVISFLTSPNQ